MIKIEKKTTTIPSYIYIDKKVKTLMLRSFFKNSFLKLQKESNTKESDLWVLGKFYNVNWENHKGLINLIKIPFMQWSVQAGLSIKEKPINLSSNILYKEKEKIEALQAIHIGPYNNVTPIYKEIINHAKEKNLTLKNESFEFYLNDPRKVKPNEIKTLILVPLKTN